MTGGIIIAYLVLYAGSIALLAHDWRRDLDVKVDDLAFFMVLSIALLGYPVWAVRAISCAAKRAAKAAPNSVIWKRK